MESVLARAHLREIGRRTYEWSGHDGEAKRTEGETRPIHIFGGVLISQAAAAAMHAMGGRVMKKKDEEEEEEGNEE